MKKILIIITFMVLLYSCAQQSKPLNGGPKDTIPPKIVKSKPKINDTNFNNTEIEIKFDEFFQMKNTSVEFLSSPPIATKPKFKISRKKLKIKLKEPLQDSSTYVFYFGNTIVDFHEANPIKNLKYTFSTYNKIDTLKIKGNIIDAYTQKPIENATIMLYRENIDSIPYKKLPNYIAKTDSAGNFEILNLRKEKYKIFALEDLNSNFIYNQDEHKIAFKDSLILPWAKNITKYDTIDSGTVVINPIIDTILDTLKHDSITITNFTEFYPNNIKLQLFTEESAIQKIKRTYRGLKGEIKLFFVKPLINNYLKVNFLNENINKNNIIYEKENPTDSAFFWFTNKKNYNKDTLKITAEYYIGKNKIKIDTIPFNDYDYKLDTIPVEIKKIKNNISIFEPFPILTEQPIAKIDTQKIHLFQIIDTVVTNEKKQKIKAIRPNYNNLVFYFARPLKKNIKITFENDEIQKARKKIKYTKNKDTAYCEIITNKTITKDSLNFKIEYDNIYFFNQIQNFSKNFKLPITAQKITHNARKHPDTIKIQMMKNLSENTKIKILDADDNEYNIKKYKNNIMLILNSEKLKNKDSLKIHLHTFDMTLANGEKKYIDDTITANFLFDKQTITYKRRYLRSKILLGFKKTFIETPEIQLISIKPRQKWCKLNISPSNDSILINITNQRVMRLNNMILLVKYFDINHHGDTIKINDTLQLKVDNITDNITETAGKEIELKLNRPIPIKITKDTSKCRKYYINANYKPNFEYLLNIDSLALTDIFERKNDSSTFKFKVFPPKHFATLVLEIKNIWAINDTIKPDTNKTYQLQKGKLTLIIEDEKEKIYKKMNTILDKTIQDQMFLPGNYKFRAYYDKNNDGYWTTGNYAKHRQPEPIFAYKSNITLNEGELKKITWDFYEQNKKITQKNDSLKNNLETPENNNNNLKK